MHNLLISKLLEIWVERIKFGNMWLVSAENLI